MPVRAADRGVAERKRRPEAITPDPDLQVQTIDRILAHAAAHPTIYLPTHDPDAAARLAAGSTL